MEKAPTAVYGARRGRQIETHVINANRCAPVALPD